MGYYGRRRSEHCSTSKASNDPLTDDDLPEFCTLGYEKSGEYEEYICDDDWNSKVASVEEPSKEDGGCKDE
jgi:hypothetical protein